MVCGTVYFEKYFEYEMILFQTSLIFTHSGSGLLGGALACLLELTATVTADALPENAQLLSYFKSISSGGEGSNISGSSVGSSSNSAALFHSLLNKTSSTSTTTSSTAPAAPLLTDPSLAAEQRTLQGYMEWRVALLQRIQLPLAVAVR